jgi:uncharacterized repeat protein (TIGR03837 family)
MAWDLFCRVVDNFGDIGVCWRVAADLAERGESVRLVVDDPSALAWMAPGGAPGVQVVPWSAAESTREVADVVIEAFGCELPAGFVARMAARRPAPVWINLEYLSAEPYVERSHRLPSPPSTGPGAGLAKWFFYPGFTPATGGLPREPDLARRQARFDAPAWLAQRGLAPNAGTRVVSLFCYANPALPDLLERLAEQPTLLLATAGSAAEQVARSLGPSLARGELTAVRLPLLSQRDYDHLLWASDLNVVRGEDSWVRAQWAARPFVWQAYPQSDGAHHTKLEAFLSRFLAGAEAGPAAELGRFWRAWNGSGTLPAVPAPAPWTRQTIAWRDALLTQADLVTRLISFAAERG